VSFGVAAGFGLLVVAALLLQWAPRRWPLAAIGAVAYGLAAAAILPEAALAAEIPGTFGIVNAGLLLAGVTIAVVAAILAVRQAASNAERALGFLAGGVALLALVPAIPYVLINGVGRASLAGLVVGGGGALLLALLGLVRAGGAFRWLDRRWRAPAPKEGRGPGWPGRRTSIGLLVVSTFTIFVLPLALILVTWAVAVPLGLHGLRASRAARPRWPIAAIGIAVLLGWVLRWLVPIAGAGWLVSYAVLLDAPVSSAAAVMLVPFVLVAGWLAIGLWPFEGLGPGPVASVVGAFILAGLGRAMLGDGVVHAAPLIGVALAVAAAHAAATDDPARLMAVLGVLGLLGPTHRSDLLMQGTLLLATIAGFWSWELRPARWGSIVWSTTGALAAAAGLWIVSDALRVETVSSTLVASATVAMLARRL
jgi:hypothetical protein